MSYEDSGMKDFIARILIGPLAILQVFFQAIGARMKLALFHQRQRAIELLAEKRTSTSKKQKILIIIPHIVKPAEASSPSDRPNKVARLLETLEGLFRSLSDYDLTIRLHTMPGHSVHEYLPDYQSKRIEVRDDFTGDPMFVEFAAQEVFIENQEKYDWFLTIEDDIVIHDSLFIKKLEQFNQKMDNPLILLQPHRYEMRLGEKVYFDLNWRVEGQDFKWNAFATLNLGEIKFGECSNPHAGMYCLNRTQLSLWEKSGRHWNRKVVMVGPLESAMSGSLFEVFRIYKSHPENIGYLEVQHWDQKYSGRLELV